MKEEYLLSQSIEKPKKKRAVCDSDLETRLSRLEQSFNSPQQDTKLLLAEADLASLRLKVLCLKQDIQSIASCFKCVVCLRIMCYPLYWSPCCGIVIGCHSCITQWLSDMSTCPHCRSNLGVNELINYPEIKGLSDVISKHVED